MGIECPAAMMQRALGDEGFAVFQEERGEADTYTLTAVQADAILRMTLGQLVNLEQEKLGGRTPASCWRRSPSTCASCPTSRTSWQIIKDESRRAADASTATPGARRSAAKNSATSTWRT